MNRPTLPELAKARAELQRFLAACPTSELAPTLRVMLRATAPLTKEEAIPVMIEHANEAGKWQSHPTDYERAMCGIEGTDFSTFAGSCRAQWATLVHFYGGAE